MKSSSVSFLALATLLSAALLLSCGDSGGDDPPPPQPPLLSNQAAIPSAVTQGTSVRFVVDVVAGSGTITSVTIDLSHFNASLSAQDMYDDGTNGDVTSGDGTYSYQYSVDPAAPTGPVVLTVTATDSNALTATADINLTVDPNNPPTISNGAISRDPVPPGGRVLFTVDASDIDGNLVSVTADLTAVGGGASAAMYDNGSNGDVTSSDGTYSLETLVSTSATGTGVSVTFTATDVALATDNTSITFDIGTNEAPLMTNESVTPSLQIQRLDVVFSVDVTDADGLNFVQVDLSPMGGPNNQPMTNTGGDTYEYTYTIPAACPQGSYKVFLNAEDTVGTTNFTYVQLSTEANDPPQLSLPLATPSTTPQNKYVLFTITATDSDGTIASVTVDLSSGLGGGSAEAMLDDGNNGDASAGDNIYSLRWYVDPAQVTAGAHNLTVTATDDDTITATDTIPVTVDTNVAPTVSNETAAPDPVEVGLSVTLTVDATDDSPPLASVVVDLSSIGGAPNQAMTNIGGDTYQYIHPIPGTGVTTGSKNLTVTATDSGSASNTGSISLTVNPNTPPNLSNAAVSDAFVLPHTQVTLTVDVTDLHTISSVTADASSVGRGTAVTMYDDGVNGGDTAIDGTWTCQFSAAGLTSPGLKSIQITATDGPGASSNTSVNLRVGRFHLEHATFLEDIHGTSSTNIYTVGEDSQVYHYDGSDWRMMDASQGGNEDWFGVWCESATSVWVGGASCQVRHFDGSDWSSRNPGGSGVLEVRGFWDDGSGTVYAAAGESGTGAGDHSGEIYVWTGTWANPVSDTDDDLHDIFGVSTSDVVAVGDDGQYYHWDGSTWNAGNIGTTHDVYGVWGYDDGTTTYYWAAVGDRARTTNIAEIWTTSYNTGSAPGTWSQITGLPFTNVDLQGIYGSVSSGSLNAIYVTGWYSNSNIYGTVWESTDGSTFTQVMTGNNYFPNAPYRLILQDVWMAPGASDVWIAGHRSVQHYVPTASPRWSEYSRGTYENTRAVDVLSTTRAITWDYPVRPTSLTRPQISSIVHEYSSGTWNEWTDVTGTIGPQLQVHTMLNPPSGQGGAQICPRMYAVKMFSSSSVWGVGDDGHVYFWNGNTSSGNDFTSQQQYGTSSANQQRLFALWGVSGSDFWFGGENGNVYHYQGSWSPAPTASQLPGTTDDVTCIWGTSNTDIYAVTGSGGSGEVFYEGGSGWTSQNGVNSLPGTIGENLNSVWGTSSDVYVVGDNGTIYHYDVANTTWSDYSSNLAGSTGINLNCVFGDSSTGEVFVVGDNMRMWCLLNSTWYAIRGNGSNADFMGGDAVSTFILMAGSRGLTLRLEK
jgi:hypothetical protein